MLTVSKVDVFIQSSHILRGVSLEVGAREVVCLVGRNGSGKTTTLRTIMGYLRPRAGSIEFRGEPIHGRRTHEIAKRGLGFNMLEYSKVMELSALPTAQHLVDAVRATLDASGGPRKNGQNGGAAWPK